ncbi:MAG TPA: sugar ABC transporter ATP-binding protein [Thermoanaerobaculia bacterium]
MALLELRGIEKRFGATVALDGVDLSIAPGEVQAVIGENGAGKSTLLNILSGLIHQDAGEMRLAGDRYSPEGPADARSRGIAHIHQELALCLHLSVAENMLMGSEPSRRGWLQRGELFDRAAKLLEEFGRSEIDPRARTGDLSLPDQQVVEICRALARDARIILMDEPTSSLQRANVERLFRLIRQLRDRGIAVIYISHFLEEVREIADRYTVLRDGKSVGSGELRSVSDNQLIAMMVGRDVELAGQPRRLSSTSDVVLTFDSVELHRGEILGIAGLIGSGRSELLRAIFERTPSAGYLPEDRKREGLALQLSIADNVTMSRFSACSRAGWIDLAKQAEQTEAVMRTLRVKAAGPRSRVFRLSGGNQQKVVVGRLLYQDPDILLLDEPARGIDIGSKSDIFRKIAELAGSGKAILMVSSYLPELFAICDRIAVMTRGRLSPARPVAEWTPESVMQVAIG